MTDAQIQMPKYECHKQVWALKIARIAEAKSNDEFATIYFEDGGYSPVTVSVDWFFSRKPEVGGYYVVYADGYSSYSPAKAFESGYTLISKL